MSREHAPRLAQRQNEVLESLRYDLSQQGNSPPHRTARRNEGADTTVLVDHVGGPEPSGIFWRIWGSEMPVVMTISLQELAVVGGRLVIL